MRRSELHFDAVVIGAGTAGLVAGTRLAQEGARVCVLAKGVGSTHLAPGDDRRARLRARPGRGPGPALEQLIAARPDHPYALIGAEVVGDALSWFAQIVPSGPLPGYVYVGSLEHNQLLPTAVGALRPSALVPETMADGEVSRLQRVCIVGTPALRDFHPSLCAANLERAGIEARAVSLDLKLERADMNTLGLARHFDDANWRRQFCAELSLTLRSDEDVGLPAMLGLRDPHAVLADVEHRLGRRVFEIPTLPPSVPGMRLYEILRSALRAAGGRLVLGARWCPLTATATASPRCRRTPPATTSLRGAVVRARLRRLCLRRRSSSTRTGSPTSACSACRCAASPPRASRASWVGYLDEQPIARVGVAVDSDLRAEGAENVLVAGAALPGAIPWREGSGEGIALASGYRAAQVVGAHMSPKAAAV